MNHSPFAMIASAALMVGVAVGGAANAQTDPHQPTNDGSAASSMTVPPGQVAPGADPGTSMANGTVQGSIQANNDQNADNQAQYQQDLSSYDAAMQAHGHAIARQDTHYARQQKAYADAMEAWRAQTYACKHGSGRACNAPTPDPADYY